MESFEQGLKAKITRDLREGRVSTNLILLTIGAGGLRLTRNQLDVIFSRPVPPWKNLTGLGKT